MACMEGINIDRVGAADICWYCMCVRELLWPAVCLCVSCVCSREIFYAVVLPIHPSKCYNSTCSKPSNITHGHTHGHRL